MERLSIDEVIAHCNRTVERFEKFNNKEKLENSEMDNSLIKEYWEHRQVAKWLEELKSNSIDVTDLLKRISEIHYDFPQVNSGVMEEIIARVTKEIVLSFEKKD